MLQKLCAAYAQQSGQKPTEMYSGNIGQIIEQAKAGSGVSIIVSEQALLEESDLAFAAYEPLGEAVLVLAWRKGLHLASAQDLTGPEFARIGYPDAKAAIYGRAAVAFLKGNSLLEPLKAKLSMLSTVPQVFSYLISGDLDAAFVNEVIASKQADSVGGWMVVREGYAPLLLVAGIVAGQENKADVRSFMQFSKTPEAQRILAASGLRPVHAAQCDLAAYPARAGRWPLAGHYAGHGRGGHKPDAGRQYCGPHQHAVARSVQRDFHWRISAGKPALRHTGDHQPFAVSWY